MSFKKVDASGTKGVGWGIGGWDVEARAWSCRSGCCTWGLRRLYCMADGSGRTLEVLTIILQIAGDGKVYRQQQIRPKF